MKALRRSTFRARPWPLRVSIASLCLVPAIVAATVASDSGAPHAFPDTPFAPGLTQDAVPAVDQPPCETLPAVSFALPVHLPPSLARPAAAAPAPHVPPEAEDPSRFLDAVAQVESRGNPARVGRLGERGLYQFRRDTWRQHTREHFSRAHHPGVATAVARRHYEWIRRQLRAHCRAGTPYEIALAWNAGVTSVISGRAPAQSHHYARRVVNLAGQS